MSVSIARKIAFEVLVRVAEQGAYADEALRGALGRSVRREDAGLATELTFGVLRWQRLLDFLVDRHLAKAGKSLDVEVRIALRLGAYQLYFLERVPARAAVHESVELVKVARKRSAAPLVNAVLRKAAKEAGAKGSATEIVAGLLPAELPAAERLGILHSHPTWMVARWLRAFGEARTETLLGANNRVPSLAGYFPAVEHREEALAALQKSGCAVRPGRLLRDAVILEGGNPSESDVARRGWLAIQDEASQCVARLMGVAAGNSVLDLCAAPGGKTLRFAMDAGTGGHVVAGDVHANRVRAMAERFEGAGLRNVESMVVDGTRALPFENKFDRILVDAPCSGTGTLARHPEIRWRIREQDLADLHGRQVLLVRNALAGLAVGGRLVYSTCSLEQEENEDVIGEALRESGGTYQLLSARGAIAGVLQESVSVDRVVGEDGFFRTFPGEEETDGFFGGVVARA
ncbi:MAG: 16S rRNA (cytosine(967)-C(5))-methyltransferase RsmB [Acidobacteriia bacterium]|nr:16S rRNA (cytosine(967)-C(5))-methyltransferase RsmB [Terriglobia bacterium]